MQKTSLVKIIFAASVLGVLALAAIAPSAARAYFPAGVTGFASRIFSAVTEEKSSSAVQTAQFPGVVEAQAPAVAASGDASVGVPAANSQTDGSPTSQDLSFTGTLTAKDGDLWTVDGVLVHVTAATELKGVLEIDTLVKVVGTLQEDGSVLACEIKPANFVDDSSNGDDGNGDSSENNQAVTGSKIEFTGALTDQADGMWVVNGLSVHLDEMTEISGAPVVGNLVMVEGWLQENGIVLAGKIKPVDVDNSDPNAAGAGIEFSGALTEQADSLWVVNGLNVHLDEMTEISGAPVVGDLVKVEGWLQEDGSVLAREIKPVNFDDDGNNVDDHNSTGNKTELTGTLIAKEGSVWTVDGYSVIVSDMTRLVGTLDVGVMVRVEGYVLDDGFIEAWQVKSFYDDSSMNNQNNNVDDDDHNDDHDNEHEDHSDGDRNRNNGDRDEDDG